MPPHVRHWLRGLPPGCGWSVTSEVGTPMRRSYVVLRRWMVIYEYGVPGGALNLNSTNYPDQGHHGDPPLPGKNPYGRAGNRTWDLVISSQKRWPLDHKAGPLWNVPGSLFCSGNEREMSAWEWRHVR
jgi:hypothetical protein